jgi:hypothetical protein
MIHGLLRNIVPQQTRVKLNQFRKSISVRVRRGLRRLNGLENSGINHLLYFYDTEGHLFCGYYDLDPFFPDKEAFLAFRAKVHNRPLHQRNSAEVGFISIDGPRRNGFVPLASTETWCWQQGCRLQWLPGSEGEIAIFNRAVNNCPGSALLDIRKCEVIREFQSPVYSVSPKGDFALTLDFVRLQRMRPGYGYSGFFEAHLGLMAPDENGIWLLSLISGLRTLVISLSELSVLEPLESMTGAEHYVNHLEFSPSGHRFLLIHLWVNGGKRYGRLITMRPDGKEIRVLNRDGHASHYAWRNDFEILQYATHADQGTGYYLYNEVTLGIVKVGIGVLTEDGHPTFLADRKRFVTDTYPDQFGDQKVILYDMEANAATDLAVFYLPPDFAGETRCDLHPRIDRAQRWVAVDVVQCGKRGVQLIPLPKSNGDRSR